MFSDGLNYLKGRFVPAVSNCRPFGYRIRFSSTTGSRHESPPLMHHLTARTCAARFSRRHGGRAAVCTGGIRQRQHGAGNPARRLHAAQDRLDGVSGGRNLRADRAGGRADRLELWNRERWEANMNAVLDMDPDELAEQLDKAGFRL